VHEQYGRSPVAQRAEKLEAAVHLQLTASPGTAADPHPAARRRERP
jgi:hypothetical protein